MSFINSLFGSFSFNYCCDGYHNEKANMDTAPVSSGKTSESVKSRISSADNVSDMDSEFVSDCAAYFLQFNDDDMDDMDDMDDDIGKKNNDSPSTNIPTEPNSDTFSNTPIEQSAFLSIIEGNPSDLLRTSSFFSTTESTEDWKGVLDQPGTVSQDKGTSKKDGDALCTILKEFKLLQDALGPLSHPVSPECHKQAIEWMVRPDVKEILESVPATISSRMLSNLVNTLQLLVQSKVTAASNEKLKYK